MRSSFSPALQALIRIVFMFVLVAPMTRAQSTQPSLPIIELRGDPAALGQAHAQALGDRFRTLYDGYFAKHLHPNALRFAERAATLFEPMLSEHHLAEMKALASGTNMSQREVMFANAMLDLMPMVSCSTITLPAAASPDGVARFGRNLDFPSLGIADKHCVVLVYHPEGRNRFVAVSWPGMIGVLSGMNEHGLALANMEVKRMPGQPRAMPYILLYRTLLEECRTVDEALARLESTPRQTANNLMLMDASGDRAVVEITPQSIHVRRGSNDAALISTNHYRGDDPNTAGRCRRYDYLHATSAESFGKVDVPMLQSMLRHVQQGPETMQSMIFEPANRVLYLATGARAAEKEMTRIDLKQYFGDASH